MDKKRTLSSCIRCHLLDKRVRFLEHVLQMKRETRDVSTQTTSEHGDDEVSTEITFSPSRMDIVDVTIGFFLVKIEDTKQNDVLFLSHHLRTHFLQSTLYFEQCHVYDGRYISLSRYETLVGSFKDDEYDEEQDRLRFLLPKLKGQSSFSLRLTFRRELCEAYDSFSSHSQVTLRCFRFTFQNI